MSHEIDALRREFEDFRREERDARKALEQKLWGLVAALFVMVVGYLFQQVQAVRNVAPPSAETAAAVIAAIVRQATGG